jgi:hypothetical protein
VEDLVAAQVGAGLELEWSRPSLTTEGTIAQRLDRMEIYATFYPEGTPLPQRPGLPESSDRVAVIQAGSGQSGDGRMRYAIPLDASRIGSRVLIALKAVNDRGRDAGFSNLVTLPIIDLPEPPVSLASEMTEQAVRLRWMPAARSAFGGAAPDVDGFRVFRREASASTAGMLVGEVQTPAFADSSFEFERTYLYSVQAFARRDGATALTPLSATVEVSAIDTFPPRPPGDIRVVATPGGIEVSWSPNEEEDLAGYYVYRSNGQGVRRLNSELLRIPAFRDEEVSAGAEYRYQVQAVDRKGNKSEPSGEVRATVE